MATGSATLILGPDDHGRAVSSEDFAEADFVEPWTYERVAGRLVVMAPEGKDHIRASNSWRDRLIAYKLTHPDVIEEVVNNAWVRGGETPERIGDIGVYLTADPPRFDVPDQVPDLMVEVVSPGRESRDRDYVAKRGDYHRLGVPEYVVVDRFEGTVTVFEWEPHDYRTRVLEANDLYTSPLLPGLVIRVGEAFGG